VTTDDSHYTDEGIVVDPAGPLSPVAESRHVFKSGSWGFNNSQVKFCEVAERQGFTASAKNVHIGFRVACNAE
jgi:formylglycine-generating enzyme required for sulfatase activity